jgi:hypothetical protein
LTVHGRPVAGEIADGERATSSVETDAMIFRMRRGE